MDEKAFGPLKLKQAQDDRGLAETPPCLRMASNTQLYNRVKSLVVNSEEMLPGITPEVMNQNLDDQQNPVEMELKCPAASDVQSLEVNTSGEPDQELSQDVLNVSPDHQENGHSQVDKLNPLSNICGTPDLSFKNNVNSCEKRDEDLTNTDCDRKGENLSLNELSKSPLPCFSSDETKQSCTEKHQISPIKTSILNKDIDKNDLCLNPEQTPDSEFLEKFHSPVCKAQCKVDQENERERDVVAPELSRQEDDSVCKLKRKLNVTKRKCTKRKRRPACDNASEDMSLSNNTSNSLEEFSGDNETKTEKSNQIINDTLIVICPPCEGVYKCAENKSEQKNESPVKNILSEEETKPLESAIVPTEELCVNSGTSSSDEVKIFDKSEVKTVKTDKDKVTYHIENTANNNIPVEDLAEVNNIVGIDLNHHQFPANNNLDDDDFLSDLPDVSKKPVKRRKKRRRSADFDVVENQDNLVKSPVVEGADIPDLPNVSGCRRSRRLRRKSLELYRVKQDKETECNDGGEELDDISPDVVIEEKVSNTSTDQCSSSNNNNLTDEVRTKKEDVTKDESEVCESNFIIPTITIQEPLTCELDKETQEDMSKKEMCVLEESLKDESIHLNNSSSNSSLLCVPNESDQTVLTVLKTPKKTKKRGKKSKSPTLEEIHDIYKNKLWKSQMPVEKKWETIFEQPHVKGNTEMLTGVRKYKRTLVEQDFYTTAKLKKRRQKALKLGWKPLTKNRQKVLDALLVEKLDQMTS